MKQLLKDAVNAIDQALAAAEKACTCATEERCKHCDDSIGARNAMQKLVELEAVLPKVVCLCGSTRFMDEFRRQNCRLTAAGVIVLSVGVSKDDLAAMQLPPHADEDCKVMLDVMHKRKIDLADEIFVLNVGGYVGSSTRSEIEYALAHGKPVAYLEA